MDGVSAVNVIFVTGIAEFDLDQETAKLEDILPRIQKETGFKFSQIVSTFQALDLLIDPPVAHQALERLKDLCESVHRVNKTTYRVSYDPTSVGARTILSSASGIRLAPPGTDGKLADGRRNLIRMAWATSLAAVFTIPVVVLAWSDAPVSSSTSSIVELVLGTFVQAIAVPEFYTGALKSLIYSRVLEMDMLVIISITVAYGYSIVAFALARAGYKVQEKAFFETSSLLITPVLLGRLIAAIAKVRAVSAVSVRSLQAEKALLSDPSAGGTIEIDARLLQLGDVFVVPAHSTVTTDGEITSGASAVDESMLTGESIPVLKAIGDHLIAGTTNGPGTLTVRLTRLPGKNSITDIAGMAENALASKPRIQDLADRIAAYFIPGVITISLLVLAIWIAVGLRVRGDNGGSAIGLSITYAIAVLAVSCPCALGLAMPMVLAIAGGIAARQGVIVKQADVIERGYKVTDVVFDKTGTITTGVLEVVHSQVFPDAGYDDEEINSVITALITDNHHPVSLAVAAYLRKKINGKPLCVENLESIPGLGIQGKWNGRVVRTGNAFWLGLEDRPEIAEMLGQGMTVLCMTVDAAPLAAFGLTSSLRPEAVNIIADLHRRGITCHIVSGDSSKAVGDVVQAVGIPPSNVASRHSPAQKQHYVQQLMDSGEIVLFCGDGTNDAVAVAQANVGVQIGTASAVTQGTADVVLLGGLDGLLTLLNLSKRTFRRIIFNFAWAAVYNLFAILLAGGAFVKVHIPPAYAGLREIVSVVPVILAALTLGAAGSASDVFNPTKKAITTKSFLRTLARLGVEHRPPPTHPLKTTKALRLLYYVSEGNERWGLTRELYRKYWVEGKDVSEPAVLVESVRKVLVGERAEEVVRAIEGGVAEGARERKMLEEATASAIERGAFGVPAFWREIPRDQEVKMEFWYDFSSPWAFLGWTQLARLQRQFGARLHIEMKPFLLGILFREIGAPNLPSLAISEAKRAYLQFDHRDWVRWWNAVNEQEGKPDKTIEFYWADVFPIRTPTVLRAVLVNPELCALLYRACWEQNLDVGSERVLAQVLDEAGYDARAILDQANSPEVKSDLRARTEEAKERGLCGVPSYRVFHRHPAMSRHLTTRLLARAAHSARQPAPVCLAQHSFRHYASAAPVPTSTITDSAPSRLEHEQAVPNPDPASDSPTTAFLNQTTPFMVPTYVRPPPMIVQGKGCVLYDNENRAYLDFTAGIAVASLGHSDAEVARIIENQAQTLIHASNLYYNPWTPTLSKLLVEETKKQSPGSPLDQVFISNSGSEANEAAIKFARKVHYAKDPSSSQRDIVSFHDSFHGRTYGSLSATPNKKYQPPFGPMLSGFRYGTYNDIGGLKDLVNENTAGVIVEPIQGEGGINVATPEFLQALRKRCDEVGAILIFDEIQCGLSRTGDLWAHTASGVHPDILTTAKALGNGIPIGATLVSGETVAPYIKTGDHGTTFGGNPFACRVAHHIFSRLADPKLQEEVKMKSTLFFSAFERLKEKYPRALGAVRGKGLIVGYQLTDEAKPKVTEIVNAARERGLLIITAGDGVVRIVPPLIISAEEINHGLAILDEAMGVAFTKE
ncbi:hypothetical protein DV737_g2699, partial [Chaetothyriales sp. CBS 132003]